MPSPPSLLQRMKALLATPNTLEEISGQFATITPPLNAIKHAIEAQKLQLTAQTLELAAVQEAEGALRRELQQLRLQIEFVKSRMANYLGSGIAITYLDDETPIYVNSLDFGGPSNLINGGRYEPANLEVLLSFVRDDSVLLDIGANLGFFSLHVGKRVRHAGKVYAFEPHPTMVRLLCASAFLNGLSSFDGQSGTITVRQIGASDRHARVNFKYPRDHLGGGTLHQLADEQPENVAGHIYPLDRIFPSNFKCDLVKIDVEGHELSVLRGMDGILTRSSNVKILFEKLAVNTGREDEVMTFLRSHGFELFLVSHDAQLKALSDEDFAGASGYVLATRPTSPPASLDRRRFHIYPRQLSTSSATMKTLSAQVLHAAGNTGEILFHGPYWFLKRGTYLVRLHGGIGGTLTISVGARLGYPELDFHLTGKQNEAVVVVPNDVVEFECIGRAASATADVVLHSLEWIKQG